MSESPAAQCRVPLFALFRCFVADAILRAYGDTARLRRVIVYDTRCARRRRCPFADTHPERKHNAHIILFRWHASIVRS